MRPPYDDEGPDVPDDGPSAAAQVRAAWRDPQAVPAVIDTTKALPDAREQYREREFPADEYDMGRPPVPVDAPPAQPEPPVRYWTEARIFRLAATIVFTIFVVGFVITASRATPLWLAWAPWLIGAAPYAAFAALAWRKHLDDESASRERAERFAQSRLTIVSPTPGATERWS